MISESLIQEKISFREEPENTENPREIVTPPARVQALLKENACTKRSMAEELKYMGFSQSAIDRLLNRDNREELVEKRSGQIISKE